MCGVLHIFEWYSLSYVVDSVLVPSSRVKKSKKQKAGEKMHGLSTAGIIVCMSLGTGDVFEKMSELSKVQAYVIVG
jgi:hypothetical protein